MVGNAHSALAQVKEKERIIEELEQAVKEKDRLMQDTLHRKGREVAARGATALEQYEAELFIQLPQPTPFWTQLKAGDTGYQAGELTETLRVPKIYNMDYNVTT